MSSIDPTVTGEVSVSTALARAHAAAPTGLGRYGALTSMLAAMGIAVAVLTLAFGERTNFEDVALGQATTPVYAKLDGHPINVKAVPTVANVMEGWKARGSRPVIAWLGNSQVHGINQVHPGETTAPLILHQALTSEGVDVLAFTQPSANLQEHYVMFEYVRHKLPLKALVLPVVFLNQRENEIRAEIGEGLKDPIVRDAIERSEVGKLIASKCVVETGPGDKDQAALRQTAQEAVEASLNDWANRNSTAWEARPEARGRIDVAINKAQKTVLGVRGQSKRRLLKVPYNTNVAALEQTLRVAAENGIKVLVYIAPIRGDVEPPYFKEEYEGFKNAVSGLCREHGAAYANLEAIIPPELWGTRTRDSFLSASEIDFFHFQAPGHAILAQSLRDLIRTEILASRIEPAAAAPTP